MVTQAFIDKENETKRKPVELYHIWTDSGTHWRMTSGDIAVVYSTNTYNPAAIERGSVSQDTTLDVTTLQVKTDSLSEPVVQYLALNPTEIIWIEVLKLHREQVPLEAEVIFIGQIKNVGFKGIQAQIDCVGFEHYLKKVIPEWRYQLTCNHFVFDSGCGLTKSSYLVSAQVTLDTTRCVLTSSAFAAFENGYFVGGEVTFGDESRTIVAHFSNTITLMYRFVELQDNDTVSAYPGCDGRRETCFEKYNNIANLLAFPDLPLENPATRVSW